MRRLFPFVKHLPVVSASPLLPRHRYHRQWWYLALAWVFIGVLLGGNLWSEQKALVYEEQARLQRQTQVVHDYLARQLTAVDQTLGTLAPTLPDPQHADEAEVAAISQHLAVLHRAMVGIGTLVWLDAHGQVLAASPPNLVGENFRERAYFQSALRADAATRTVVGAPLAPTPGQWLLPLARPVRDASGQVQSVLAVGLLPQDFYIVLRSVLYAPDMRSAILHGDGEQFVQQAERLAASAEDAPPADNLLLAPAFQQMGHAPMLAQRLVQPPVLKMDKPLQVTLQRSSVAVLAPWRAKAWAVLLSYLLAGGLLSVGMFNMQQHARRVQQQERDLQDKDQALDDLWHAVLVATGQGVWDCDVAAQQVYFSTAWKSLLGYADEDVGHTVRDWTVRIHPDDWPQVNQAWTDCLAGRSDELECVYRLRCKDGSYRWSLGKGRVIERNLQGQALRIVGTNTDVSEERRLRERFERLTQNVPGMIFQFQLEPDGSSHFPYASKSMQALYGTQGAPERSASSLALLSIIHPEDASAVGQSIERSAIDLSIWSQEYRVCLPGAPQRWVRGVARPQRLDGGAVLWHGYIQDISHGKQQAMQLEETQRMLQHLIHAMPVALCMVDDARCIYFRNQRFLDYFGYTEAEIPTMDCWAQTVYPDTAYRSHVARAWRSALEHARSHDGYIPSQEYRIRAKSGNVLTAAIGGVQFGKNLLVTFVDRTADQAHSEMLEKMAFVDALTGLPNRRQFDQSLHAEWLRGQRGHEPLALMMIDIDFFKQYNDAYGHPGGDACLRAVAKVLRHAVGRSYDLVARYGGEEFACLLPECGLQGAQDKAWAMCQAVRALQLPHARSPVGPSVTISIGVAAIVPSAEHTPEQLLALADSRLYRAKAIGRNQVCALDAENVSI